MADGRNTFGRVLAILGALTAMLISGAGATLLAISFFINLGLKQFDNYEVYGSSPLAQLAIVAFGALGFALPGFVIWRLHKASWQFRLRDIIVAITLVAIVLGIYSLSL